MPLTYIYSFATLREPVLLSVIDRIFFLMTEKNKSIRSSCPKRKASEYCYGEFQ